MFVSGLYFYKCHPIFFDVHISPVSYLLLKVELTCVCCHSAHAVRMRLAGHVVLRLSGTKPSQPGRARPAACVVSASAGRSSWARPRRGDLTVTGVPAALRSTCRRRTFLCRITSPRVQVGPRSVFQPWLPYFLFVDAAGAPTDGFSLEGCRRAGFSHHPRALLGYERSQVWGIR
jgi:hypothetical protein